MYSVGFPKTESGVEIKILKKMFSEEDAQLFLQMTPFLAKPSGIAEKAGRDASEVEEHLESMAQKGLIFRLRRSDKVMYAASPFVVGSFEFQLKRMDREFAELIEQFFEEGFLSKGMTSSYPPLRTIPIYQSIEAEMNVASYQDAREIIKSKEKIALADCICRTQQSLVDSGCGKPMEACLVFGSHAEYYVENGLARFIDVDEALKVLEVCEDAGLVNQPASIVNPGGMCACCGDCCGILRALKLTPNPAELVQNNYWAVVDKDECTACETCEERCQIDAVTFDENSLAVIDTDRCIGCGLCVTTCPGDAISLVLKPEDKRTAVFESNKDLMIATAEKRGIIKPGQMG